MEKRSEMAMAPGMAWPAALLLLTVLCARLPPPLCAAEPRAKRMNVLFLVVVSAQLRSHH